MDNLPLFEKSALGDMWKMAPQRCENLLGYYLEDLPGQIGGIHAALGAHNVEEVGRIAHALKSSSRQIGALRLGELAWQLEQQARGGGTAEGIEQMMGVLDSLVEATVTALREQTGRGV